LAFRVNSASIFCHATEVLTLSVLLAVLLLSSTFSLAQESAKSSSETTLRISGKIKRPMVLWAADLQRLPHKRLTVTDERGVRVTYELLPKVVDLMRA
jgi:hypothetical protein